MLVEGFLRVPVHAHISDQKPSVDVLQPARQKRLVAVLCLRAECSAGNKMLLRAIVVRQKGKAGSDLAKRAALLELDSIHGKVGSHAWRLAVSCPLNAHSCHCVAFLSSMDALPSTRNATPSSPMDA